MKSFKDELTNLTRAQVEALLECFDFLANGYEERSCFEVSDLWVIQLRHKRTMRAIRVFIHPDRYRIVRDGVTKKKVLFSLDNYRFSIIVNSDSSVGVIRTSPCVGMT